MSSRQSKLEKNLSRIVSANCIPLDLIIADAKDRDMGGGANAVGLEK